KPRERVGAERDEGEHGVRRVDERERAERRREREQERALPRLGEGEEERDARWDEELTRGSRRERERRPRTAVPGRKDEQPEPAEEHRASTAGGSEHRDTCLPGDDTRDRREDRRLVADHDSRIEPGHLRHERVEAVPERERVARVKAAVLELVDRSQVKIAEVEQLADAREVEERIAGDRVG